ncbi:MAG: hypothetical protein R3E87_22335 [Burkholderiaceae bacterium]
MSTRASFRLSLLAALVASALAACGGGGGSTVAADEATASGDSGSGAEGTSAASGGATSDASGSDPAAASGSASGGTNGTTIGSGVTGNAGSSDGSGGNGVVSGSTGGSTTGGEVVVTPVVPPPIDCANQFPCRWTSPNGQVTVVLTDSSIVYTGAVTRTPPARGGLAVNAQVTVTRDTTLTMGTAATAAGPDGGVFAAEKAALGGLETQSGTFMINMTPALLASGGYAFAPMITGVENSLARVKFDLAMGPDRLDPEFVNVATGPAETVACLNILPCNWLSRDRQDLITITQADSESPRNLRAMTVSFAYDPGISRAVAINDKGAATDADNKSYRPSRVALGGVSGFNLATAALTQGTVVRGNQVFLEEAPPLRNTLERLSLDFSTHKPVFIGVPTGRAPSNDVDCANVLPCQWVSANDEVRVTVTSVNRGASSGRLRMQATVQSSRNAEFGIADAGLATGSQLTTFVPSVLRLGAASSVSEAIGVVTSASPVAAQIDYMQAPLGTEDALQRLQITLYETRPVPRLNPVFLNLPIQ